MLPPILMQVDDPSILTKPEPYSAQGFAAAFAGRICQVVWRRGKTLGVKFVR